MRSKLQTLLSQPELLSLLFSCIAANRVFMHKLVRTHEFAICICILVVRYASAITNAVLSRCLSRRNPLTYPVI